MRSLSDKLSLYYINTGIFLDTAVTFLRKKILAIFGVLLVAITAGMGIIKLPFAETMLLFRAPTTEVAKASRAGFTTASKVSSITEQDQNDAEEPGHANNTSPTITIYVPSFQAALNTLDNISQDALLLFMRYKKSQHSFNTSTSNHTMHVSFFLIANDDSTKDKLLSTYNIPKDSKINYIEIVTNTSSSNQGQLKHNQALSAPTREIDHPTHATTPHHFIKVSTPQQIRSTIEGISGRGHVIYNVKHRISGTNNKQLRGVSFDLGPEIFTGNPWQHKSYNLPIGYQGKIHLELAD